MWQPDLVGVSLLGQGHGGSVAAARAQAEGAGAAALAPTLALLTLTLTRIRTPTLALTLAFSLPLTLAQEALFKEAQRIDAQVSADEGVLQPPMFGRGMPPVCSCVMAFRRTPRVRRLLSHAAARLAHH